MLVFFNIFSFILCFFMSFTLLKLQISPLPPEALLLSFTAMLLLSSIKALLLTSPKLLETLSD